MDADSPLVLREGRFARLQAIQWWQQQRMAAARIMVVGAGALGNEVIKNLAMLGIGQLVIVDMDTVEMSNLSRSVLYRAEDEGAFKAECAATAARQIYPQLDVVPLVANVLSDVGLGWFRWADIVIGALDNREARAFVNTACSQLGRPWIDGGIEVLNGIARVFHAPRHACYECTMSAVDWDLLNKRRSCSLLARRALQQSGTPTTPTTASIIGAIQVQEAVKLLHGRDEFVGCGVFFDGVSHNSYPITYDIKPDCPWHEPPPPVVAVASLSSQESLRDVIRCAADQLGGAVVALEFSRELVQSMQCPSCSDRREIFLPIHRVDSAAAVCARCGAETVPEFLHGLQPHDPLIDKSIAELGLPVRDVIWARDAMNYVGIEIAGDNFA